MVQWWLHSSNKVFHTFNIYVKFNKRNIRDMSAWKISRPAFPCRKVSTQESMANSKCLRTCFTRFQLIRTTIDTLWRRRPTRNRTSSNSRYNQGNMIRATVCTYKTSIAPPGLQTMPTLMRGWLFRKNNRQAGLVGVPRLNFKIPC